jgi:hypothetical protein
VRWQPRPDTRIYVIGVAQSGGLLRAAAGRTFESETPQAERDPEDGCLFSCGKRLAAAGHAAAERGRKYDGDERVAGCVGSPEKMIVCACGLASDRARRARSGRRDRERLAERRRGRAGGNGTEREEHAAHLAAVGEMVLRLNPEELDVGHVGRDVRERESASHEHGLLDGKGPARTSGACERRKRRARGESQISKRALQDVRLPGEGCPYIRLRSGRARQRLHAWSTGRGRTLTLVRRRAHVSLEYHCLRVCW